MRGRGIIRTTRLRGLAEPRRSNGGRVELLFTKLKRGRLVTARNHFCRDYSGCRGKAEGTCGNDSNFMRRAKTDRVTTMRLDHLRRQRVAGTRKALERLGGSGGSGGVPPEQAPVSARLGPRARRRARPGGADESADGGVDRSRSGDVRAGRPLSGRGHRHRRRPPSRTTPVRHEPRTSAAPWGSSSWERDPSGRRTARRSPRTVHRTTWGAEPAGRRRRCRAPPPTSSEETSPGSTSVDLLRS